MRLRPPLVVFFGVSLLGPCICSRDYAEEVDLHGVELRSLLTDDSCNLAQAECALSALQISGRRLALRTADIEVESPESEMGPAFAPVATTTADASIPSTSIVDEVVSTSASTSDTPTSPTATTSFTAQPSSSTQLQLNTTTTTEAPTTTQPTSICTEASVIPNSNRTAEHPCFADSIGAECSYSCDPGYISIGRHVCQTIKIQGKTWKENAFFGGSCNRLCPSTAQACLEGQVPVRTNISDDQGPCLQTTCMTPDQAFRNLARGNYELWRLARDERTGCYYDNVNLDSPNGTQLIAGSDMTGIGLIMECIADKMGWISRTEFISRVNLTMSALANKLGSWWQLPRGPGGWLPRTFNLETGAVTAEGTEAVSDIGKTYSVMSTGIAYSGILFVRTYLKNNGVGMDEAKVIDLVEHLMDLVGWSNIMCLEKWGSTDVIFGWNGTGLPMLQTEGGGCLSVLWPAADGFYPFVNEELLAVSISYEKVCGTQQSQKCSLAAIEQMWGQVIGRRFHPEVNFSGYNLLTRWPSYSVQIPYYMVHAFNTDPTFSNLFRDQWLAEWAQYNSSVYYGDSSRYGLGAGPEMTWCSGHEYFAAQLTDDANKGGCRTWSPYAVAGYLPAEPETIKEHLLQMLANGEATLQVPNTDYHVLWRKSMIDPAKNWSNYITMVDIASELWGLSTIWLGRRFYIQNTDHFNWATGYVHAPYGGEVSDQS